MHKFYVDRSAGDRKSFARRADDAPKPRGDLDSDEEDSIVSQETDDVIFFSNWTTAIVCQVHKWNRGADAFSARFAKKDIA